MLNQPLLEKLTRLRLPGFRAGLQEQWESPHYAELTFDDRLGLLVDLECTPVPGAGPSGQPQPPAPHEGRSVQPASCA